MSKLVEFGERMSAIKAEIKEFAKANAEPAVLELFQPLFNLGISAAGWVQYVPGFNDGDPCEFSIGDVFVGNAEHDDGSSERTTAWNISYGYRTDDKTYIKAAEGAGVTPETAEAVVAALNEIEKTLNANEDFAEIAFGSNAIITVTPSGVTSDYYECGW